jgi:hypothetical protein
MRKKIYLHKSEPEIYNDFENLAYVQLSKVKYLDLLDTNGPY